MFIDISKYVSNKLSSSTGKIRKFSDFIWIFIIFIWLISLIFSFIIGTETAIETRVSIYILLCLIFLIYKILEHYLTNKKK